MTKRHEMIANMTSKMESCKTKVAEMKDQNANVSKKMEQTHGQIVELNVKWAN
jgi:chaperonin cofactor prefoldin